MASQPMFNVVVTSDRYSNEPNEPFVELTRHGETVSLALERELIAAVTDLEVNLLARASTTRR